MIGLNKAVVDIISPTIVTIVAGGNGGNGGGASTL
jgi:hypothetical protein